MSLQAGSVFAGYTIERVLGRGGMGVVYLARHPRLGRSVALKVLDVDPVTNSRARVEFDREAALAAVLVHPNIVPVHDRSKPDDSALWLSMRFIGGNCAALLSTEPAGLAPERAVRLVTDAAHALDFAHKHNVLHRDVKPANLLIEHDPRHGERALLTDFGIARTFDDDSTRTTISATFAYVAPERFTSRPTDYRADQYSLGCTLYHLLTGSHPFPYPDDARVINAHINEPPPAPSKQRPHLPAALDVVIATALAKVPEERYRSCIDLAEAAARALSQTEGVTRPNPRVRQSPSEPKPKLSRRRLLIGGACAIPIAGIAAASITRCSGDDPAQQQISLPFIGLNKPHGVAVDGTGGVYVTDNANNRVVKLSAGSSNPETLPFDGLAAPTGVAVDETGSVYVADYGNHRVLQLPAAASNSDSQVTLPFTDLRYPYGVAIAPSGAVCVTDTESRRVLRLAVGSTNTETLPFEGLAGPTGTAVDKWGAVYVAAHANPQNENEHNQVQRLPLGPNEAETLPFTGLANPTGVAVDKWGVVYLADYDNNRVLELHGPRDSGASGG